MADITIPQLNAATSVSGTDLTVISQAGVTKKVEVDKLTEKVLSSSVDVLHMNPNTVQTLANIGELAFNPDTQTLEVKCSADVTLSIGQENYIRGKNAEASTILNGTVVYVSGGIGANSLIKRAGNAGGTAERVIGVATQDIGANNIGFITTSGIVNKLDTSAYLEGALLWLGANGAMTNVKPDTIVDQICIGVVLRSHATEGSILVAVKDDWRDKLAEVRSDLNELEDRTSVLELEIGGGNNYTEGFYIDRTGNYVANENYSYSERIYVTADDLSKGLYWYYGEYLNVYTSLILLAGNEVINFYGMSNGGSFRNLSPSQLESSIQGGVDNIIISFKTSTGGILRTASDNKDLYVSGIKEGLKDGFNILEDSVEKVDREVFGVVASSEPTSETKLNMINLEVKAGDKIRMKVNATNGWDRIIFLGNNGNDRLIDSLGIQINNNKYIEYTATKDIHDFGLYISSSSETSMILTVEAIKGLVEKVKETTGEAFVYIHPSDTQIEIYEKMLGAVSDGDKTVIFEQGNYFFDENLINYIKGKFPSRSTGFELPIGNNCKYFFNNSVLEGRNESVDNDDWSGTNVLGCRWCIPGFELHDGVVIARDIRYCIHDDPYNVSKGYINKYINMHCIYEGGTRAASGYIYKPIGGGSGRIGMAVFDGCVIEKNNHSDSKALTYHGTSYEWNTENRFRLSIQNSWIGGDIGIYRTPENPDEILELIVCGSTYKSDISDSLSVDRKWNNTIIS